jgi:hypothetical protein
MAAAETRFEQKHRKLVTVASLFIAGLRQKYN